MKNHRRLHLLAWLVVGPLAIATLVLGIRSRQDVPAQTAPPSPEPSLPETDPPSQELPR